MKNILERLKSPVVIIQLITILGTIAVLVLPGYSEEFKEIVGSLAVIVNVFAGLNNPTTPNSF